MLAAWGISMTRPVRTTPECIPLSPPAGGAPLLSALGSLLWEAAHFSGIHLAHATPDVVLGGAALLRCLGRRDVGSRSAPFPGRGFHLCPLVLDRLLEPCSLHVSKVANSMRCGSFLAHDLKPKTKRMYTPFLLLVPGPAPLL